MESPKQALRARIKCVVVGDCDVGKTSLLHVYASDWFPPDKYCPCSATYGSHTKDMIVNNQLITLKLKETPGQQDYDRLRPLYYTDTDVFLICFSLVSRASFENVRTKWVPELSQHCPSTPIVLVGSKLDLRNGENTLSKLYKDDKTPISFSEGLSMAEEIEATNYKECSALERMGINVVFDEAIREVLSKKN